jgi:hypothetical protein
MTGLDLAVIGNGTVASVIASAGRHVWFCFPRLAADPVFNALPGGAAPEGGLLETRLRDQSEAEQRYLPTTAVLENAPADRNHLGVLSEDSAAGAGTPRGNFLQTYSQVGSIFAAMRLSRSWEEGLWRA